MERKNPRDENEISERPYRKNVAALIRCGEKFLMCRRHDHQAWQSVQGGYESSDGSPENAIMRELNEELGAPQECFSIIYRSTSWRRYVFPPSIRVGNYVGQEQLWFEVTLRSFEDIELSKSCGEFVEVKLANLEELLAGYADWKKQPLLGFCRERRLCNFCEGDNG